MCTRRVATTHRFALGALLLGALFSSTLGAHAAPLSAEARRQVLQQGSAQLDARKSSLRERAAVSPAQAATVEVTRMKGKGAQAMKLSYADARGHKTRLLLRVPGRGTTWGARANDTVALLAAQLGEPQWVPAGFVAEPGTFAGIAGLVHDVGRKEASDVGKIMVTEFVKGFRDGEDAPVEWLSKTPETTRLKAAVLDVLTLARDRKLANVMVDDKGEVRLIDHDVTFGMKEEKGPHFASTFWKGQALGYRSKQARFEDLPDDVRTLVQAIAEEDPSALQQTYALGKPERVELVQRLAKEIVQNGLDAASARIVSEAAQRQFVRADDTPNAARLLNGN